MSNPQSPRTPTMVIICGLPASGKSTLAADLRNQLGWPLLAKDTLKELLYDAANPDSAAFSRANSSKMGLQSIRLLLMLGRELLESGVSCILEANFRPDIAGPDLAPLVAISNCRQVHCVVENDLVLTRYGERARSGLRHPVHLDQEALAGLQTEIELGRSGPVNLGVPTLSVDTTSGWNPSLDEIVTFCRS